MTTRIVSQPDPRDDGETFDPSQFAVNADTPSLDKGAEVDPFDPAALRIDPDNAEALEVEAVLTTIPVRKPSREAFVRTHPDEKFRLATFVLELKDEMGEIWLVAPTLRAHLLGEPTFTARTLVLAITLSGDPFLWPLKMAGANGQVDNWTRTARTAADLARTAWVRVFAKPGGSCYTVTRAKGALPEPIWPTSSMAELLKLAFQDRYIDTPDHPVLRKLRGEV